jgi:hypothetical protein
MCDGIARYENSCTFQFGDGQKFNAYCPWRIVVDGHIACSDEDHGHWFGLDAPVDVQVVANRHLLREKVIAVEISKGTGDVAIVFENSIRLELFNNSSGYEAWEAFVRRDSAQYNIIAQGGGQILVWSSE